MCAYDSEWYRRWYEEKGDRVRAQRRKRYRDDKSYRESQCRRARNRKRRLKGFQGRRLKPSVWLVRLQVSGEWTWVKAMSFGFLSKVVGFSKDVLRRWEDSGLFPVTPLFVLGSRLYTRPMMTTVKRALRKRKKDPRADFDVSFHDEVLAGWQKDLAEYDLIV